MFTGIASHAGALGAALVVLIGAAILHDGPAAADPNQDDRFLALLEKKEIPAVANVPRVIDAAHKVCRKLDGGMPVNDIVDGLRNDAYNIDPVMRLYPVRLTTTMTRFISAAVEIYCPNHHSKMAFAMANFEPGSNEPTHRVAASTRSAVNSGSDLRASVSDMTIMSPGWREPTGAMLASAPRGCRDRSTSLFTVRRKPSCITCGHTFATSAVWMPNGRRRSPVTGGADAPRRCSANGRKNWLRRRPGLTRSAIPGRKISPRTRCGASTRARDVMPATVGECRRSLTSSTNTLPCNAVGRCTPVVPTWAI